MCTTLTTIAHKFLMWRICTQLAHFYECKPVQSPRGNSGHARPSQRGHELLRLDALPLVSYSMSASGARRCVLTVLPTATSMRGVFKCKSLNLVQVQVVLGATSAARVQCLHQATELPSRFVVKQLGSSHAVLYGPGVAVQVLLLGGRPQPQVGLHLCIRVWLPCDRVTNLPTCSLKNTCLCQNLSVLSHRVFPVHSATAQQNSAL